MREKRIPVPCLLLYAIAGILALYAVWAAGHSIHYVSQLVLQGELTVAGNRYDIVNFVLSNSAQYALFAITLSALGWMLQQLPASHSPDSRANSGKAPTDRAAMAGDEDDFDDWFHNQAM